MTPSPSLPARSQNKGFFVFLITAVAFSFLLGFIDEGYYDFRWMKDPGNWIALGVYGLFMLVGQLVFFHILLADYRGRGKIALSAVLGPVVGAAALMGIFYALH